MNIIILEGYVGQNPEMKTFDNGNCVVSFSLATSKSYKKNNDIVQETQWHNCIAWNKRGEAIHKYINKGAHVSIVGELRYENYKDKNNNDRRVAKIQVNEFNFLDKKSNQQQSTNVNEVNNQGNEDDLPF